MPRQKAEALAVGDTVRLLKGAHEGAVGVVLEKTGGGWMKILTPLGTVKVQGRASVDKVDQVAAGKENAGTVPPAMVRTEETATDPTPRGRPPVEPITPARPAPYEPTPYEPVTGTTSGVRR